MNKIFLFLLLSASSAAGAISFVGVVGSTSCFTFGLSDKESGKNGWAGIGDSFENYIVSDYDMGTQTLTLKKGAAIYRLKLQSQKASDADDRTRIAEKRLLNDARQIAAASQQYMLETGTDSVEISLNEDGTMSGPLAEYIKKLGPGTKVVQGHLKVDGSFALKQSDAFEGREIVFDQEGHQK